MNERDIRELTNIIYDTLMCNTAFPQFDVEKVGDCLCDETKHKIEFEYIGQKYTITIEGV